MMNNERAYMKLSGRYYSYLTFILIAVFYVVVSLLAPLAPNRYDLKSATTHWLQLTIYLPVVIIWSIAFVGSDQFVKYATAIRAHKDGAAFSKIALGFIVLTAAIITSGLVGLVRPWALKDGWLSAYTLFSNHVAVFLPLIAYALMFAGSKELCRSIKARPIKRQMASLVVVGITAVGVLYAVILTQYKYASSTPDPTRYSSFYMSKPLVLLTIALPYYLGWLLALSAAYNLHIYRQQVKGIIYKEALIRLELGVLTVVAFYIVAQMLVAFSTFFASAKLVAILLVVYLIIILYGLGFWLIGRGANRLLKIEEIK